MSKVEIEVYRGWTISFDTDKETFYCHSEQYDSDATKKSFSAVKKFIDDFIKDNENFKPVVVQYVPDSHNAGKCLTIIGVRKDGRFIIDKNGAKEQLSTYDENRLIVYNKNNDIYWEKSAQIQSEIDRLRVEQKEVENKITGKKLTELK